MSDASCHVAGNVKAVAELLVAGANPSVVLRDGATALHMAAWKGHADVLIKLLEHAVVIDVRELLFWKRIQMILI